MVHKMPWSRHLTTAWITNSYRSLAYRTCAAPTPPRASVRLPQGSSSVRSGAGADASRRTSRARAAVLQGTPNHAYATPGSSSNASAICCPPPVLKSSRTHSTDGEWRLACRSMPIARKRLLLNAFVRAADPQKNSRKTGALSGSPCALGAATRCPTRPGAGAGHGILPPPLQPPLAAGRGGLGAANSGRSCCVGAVPLSNAGVARKICRTWLDARPGPSAAGTLAATGASPLPAAGSQWLPTAGCAWKHLAHTCFPRLQAPPATASLQPRDGML